MRVLHYAKPFFRITRTYRTKQTYLKIGTNIPLPGYGKLDWIAVILQHNNRIKFK